MYFETSQTLIREVESIYNVLDDARTNIASSSSLLKQCVHLRIQKIRKDSFLNYL